jgi:hypothetical protein
MKYLRFTAYQLAENNNLNTISVCKKNMQAMIGKGIF